MRTATGNCMVFQGACYLHADAYNPEVNAAARQIALMVRTAQHKDSYLNMYSTVVKPGKRWTDIRVHFLAQQRTNEHT
ncbi:putative duf1680 domain protein [Eutypa lata UCREL1]|uniref:Putative duf1680 domain protein n=1 Tax=Eutypa lata (strain UCR-EL1) TaxID=1287681 RepID=M7SGI5_EUTLA|nr:putative duf1680 domain protein [Eutypa lata UCREL1]